MDDVSIDLVNRDPNKANAWYLGSQALELTLYAAARGKHARIVESEHFEMGNGVLSQIEASGFELSVMPLLSADEKYVTAVYSLRQKGEGPEAESRWLESGQRTVPVGGSLGFGFPGAPSRKKVLLLHFASVGPEKP
ncbi:MAG: hypothetical protein HY293_03855 [Planctomycetes bacterium]|nr:hypothetical protein [Planctomycetota bacterium]